MKQPGFAVPVRMLVRRTLSEFYRATSATVICSAFGLAIAFAQAQADATQRYGTEDSLRQFLQTLSDDKATRYAFALSDLNGDGRAEAIVHLIGNEWCGSGGCNTLVLARDGRSWKIVTNITITQLPIRVLHRTSNGWHSLGVWVQGGGIQPGYEAELRFDGKAYPRNPSASPSGRLTGDVPGEIVISSSLVGLPLFAAASGNQAQAASKDSQAPRPSFSCADAQSLTENLVCRDGNLASMDSAMAAAYRGALKRLPSEQAAALRREQLQWFKRYKLECESKAADIERKACIVHHLGFRLQQLKDVCAQ